MNLFLIKAELKDAETIHTMQIKSFMPLLNKYQDYETNPANEPIEKVINRIKQSVTDYYIIKCDDLTIGGVRIINKDNNFYRISPIFILPEHQGMGIAQRVLQMLEQKYDVMGWELDTILQETKNCYLYEKMGYKKTGETKYINSKLTLVFYEKFLG